MTSGINEPRVPKAEDLFWNARSCVAAAARLVGAEKAGELDVAFAPAFYLLVGFAIELLLKAICLRAGATNDDLRNKIGHDLVKAYELALAQSEKAPDHLKIPYKLKIMQPFGRLACELNQHHRDHTFRYTPNDSELVVPSPSYCVHALRDALTIVSENWGFDEQLEEAKAVMPQPQKRRCSVCCTMGMSATRAWQP